MERLDFVVKDRSMRPIGVVDLYNSALWTERFNEAGSFQLYMPVNTAYLEKLEIGNYMTLPDTEVVMIIESMQIESRIETGERVILYEGSSLESILKRRIVWNKTYLTGLADANIRKLLEENIIFSTNSGRTPPRRIENFIYPASTDAELNAYIAQAGAIECQFEGDNLYDAIKSICDAIGIGFRITVDSSKRFVFQLYMGTDRTISQVVDDPVIFSPEYDNLISSRYLVNYADYKNVALVAGEEENNARITKTVYSGSAEPTGLDRREHYANASDISQRQNNGTTISRDDYLKLLQYRGASELQENSAVSAFDGEVETKIGPAYGTNYFLGDYVSTMNEYGFGTTAQITEYTRSFDLQGYSAYPTFVMI